jgi:uncharacterized protein (TIGR02001 family)
LERAPMNLRSLFAHTAVATLGAATLAPGVAWAEMSFNVGGVSDYRYRGISQSRLKPALQGGADYSLSGFYVGTWASTIKWIKDGGGDADVEVDIYGGYKGEISKALSYDVGLLTYQYPGHKLATSPNTLEVYGALTSGPWTLKYSHSTTNLFGFNDSKGSGYLDLSGNFDLGSGFGLAPHLGYQRVARNGNFSYTDYAILGTYEPVKNLVVCAGVYGADTKKIAGTPAYTSPANGKDMGKAGVVVGAKYSF